MTRFVGAKHNTIYTVSNCSFTSDTYFVLEVPSELDAIPASTLMIDYRVRNGKIVAKNAKIAAKDLKVAFIGNWKMACGISTYNERLFPEIAKHINSFKLFVERNSNKTGSIYSFGDQTLQSNDIVECWERGKGLQELVDLVKQYDPDIIIVSHEFGLFSNASYYLSMMGQLSDYRIITIVHSTFHHHDKTICEAAMREIVVHIESAKDVLKQKGITAKTYVIPHGCVPVSNKERLWNFYKTDHTFITSGFAFPYKNFQASIKACAILKKKYADVFFTAIFSESPQNTHTHQIYYNELISLVEELGVKENVAIIRGFQSEEVMDSYLRTNKVAVFPYALQKGHEVQGASGAARQAMTTNIPVISSRIPHFSDLPTIKTDTPEDIARELDRLFSNPSAIKEQLDKQERFLIENSWDKIALKFVEVLERS